MPGVKILCVHGVGHAEQDPHWNQPWRDAAKQWYHLFNHQDGTFTAEIQEPGCTNFLEVVTDSAAGQSATTIGNNPGYLDHPVRGDW
jgi:hypothetical protein